jgi:predicted dinucleotide-binding enzyme
MRIAIIGTGHMGLGLARLLLAKGHTVELVHKDPAVARRHAGELGMGARGAAPAQAVSGAELVILAVPFASAPAALAAAGDLSGKTLVDITNPITPDYLALTIGHTTSAAEEIAKLAPGAHVVKAFNTIFWQALPFEVRRGKPAVQVFLAGDDPTSKQLVTALVTDLEFEAVDAGPLTNARYVEPVGELNIHFGYALGWGTGVAPAWVRL